MANTPVTSRPWPVSVHTDGLTAPSTRRSRHPAQRGPHGGRRGGL